MKQVFTPSQARERGFTLLELLVALAIGVLLMTSVLMVMSNSSRAARATEAEAAMNEEAMLAMNILQQQIRLAGYTNRKRDAAGKLVPNFEGQSIFACDDGFAAANAGFESLECGDSDDIDSAAIAIRYEADTTNTSPTGDDKPTNCLMNGITESSGYYLADNRYFVAKKSGDENFNLYCASGGQQQPLIENVQQLRFQFGVTDSHERSSQQIMTYLDAERLNQNTNRSQSWGKVLSVEICLVMRSADKVLDGQKKLNGVFVNQKYIDCDGSIAEKDDLYLYRTYRSTATVRNRVAMPGVAE